jgi:hypothetical protein
MRNCFLPLPLYDNLPIWFNELSHHLRHLVLALTKQLILGYLLCHHFSVTLLFQIPQQSLLFVITGLLCCSNGQLYAERLFIMMAIYIDYLFVAWQYLVYQPHLSSQEVLRLDSDGLDFQHLMQCVSRSNTIVQAFNLTNKSSII